MYVFFKIIYIKSMVCISDEVDHPLIFCIFVFIIKRTIVKQRAEIFLSIFNGKY